MDIYQILTYSTPPLTLFNIQASIVSSSLPMQPRLINFDHLISLPTHFFRSWTLQSSKNIRETRLTSGDNYEMVQLAKRADLKEFTENIELMLLLYLVCQPMDLTGFMLWEGEFFILNLG